MLITSLLGVILNVVVAICFFLPSVTALPTIGGYDIDSALTTGVGQAYQFASVVWPIWDVLMGALVLWGFHGLMMLVKFILGHRAPTA